MEDYTVQSVDKALSLLEALSEFPHGVSITELSIRLGLYKSTAHRLLGTMMKRGYVEQDAETGKYKLGFTVADLGMRLLSSIDMRHEALPFLQEMAEVTGEVAHLALMDGRDVVYIEKVDSASTIRMHSRVGMRVYAHATGLGKAMLAAMSEAESRAFVQRYGLPKLTEHTVTDAEKLYKEFQTIRLTGCAVAKEENEVGICCVASAIRNSRGQVAAACSVSGPCSRMDANKIKQVMPLVREMAEKISSRLGFRAGVSETV
ncbi:MAG: IclR family transcriptional regulator [Sulfobacillus thermosulfidooxidans]|uniref:IclR family transcriptional regulator n=1 Tax=Sulfobacillus thermotolerans TaxID=338644 RepID=A0ABM6RQ23_9FIRM|nr:IclR family transcriptional regulator [Sulfobacillus sp. hq2]AUW93420.1 IclR family transcriptional regulator [Sulfobacillus thermotolerans]MCY0906940.1 IclR family transcriptional regulator [Sulfobacillus thermotolerans]POB10652.1 IclR family transcriptional regulator [Sulfobacillus sp. hq2]PSR37697.1 MAG: IclR family transcriptional regulator [Sulfobacillus thermosulfidooxidans]